MGFFLIYRNICVIIVLMNVCSVVMCLQLGETVNDVMTSLADNLNDTDKVPVREIGKSETVVLLCRSNDKEHFFMFWLLPKDNVIVGPTNKFDNLKYDYEILSGNLTIHHVTKDEEGMYYCLSKGVHDNKINIRAVRIAINQHAITEPEKYYLVVVGIILVLLVISGVMYYVYFMIRKRHKKGILLETSSDDEDSGEEIFRAPGTSKQVDPIDFIRSRDEDDDGRIEIPKISIDFEDILENSQK